ncbi:hypothetical protein AB6813_11640 [bacterium RCC_150]
MSPWFKRPEVSSPLAESPVRFVSAATAINASRRQIWDLIKPPEKAELLAPGVVCGFRAPAVEGFGEIQVFISMLGGAEHVFAVEVMEEIPEELAITRYLGDEDPAARMRYFVYADDDGATILDVGRYFTLPAEEAENFAKYEDRYKSGCRRYVEKVKAFFG